MRNLESKKLEKLLLQIITKKASFTNNLILGYIKIIVRFYENN